MQQKIKILYDNLISIQNLYKNGMSCKEIGKRFNVSSTTIQRFFKKNHIKIHGPRKIEYEFIPKIIEEYKNGLTSKQVGKKYNITGGAVISILKRNNIRARKKTEYRKRELNENFFDDPETWTEKQAYFLGFLYADGNVHYNKNDNSYRLQLNLHEKDKCILEIFASFLYKKEPYLRKINSKNQFCLDIHSHKLCKQLINCGCVPQKTFILKFPQFIRDDLISHFIRGMMDGDGCIYTGNNNGTHRIRFSLMATYEICDKLKEIFKQKLQINTHQHIYNPTKNVKTLYVGGSLQVIKLCEYLYKDATFFLQRKKQKYLNFLDSRQK